MLRPRLRHNSALSPSVLRDLEAKGVDTSKRANIVSPSEVAEVHNGCFPVISVIIATEDNALPRSPRKMARTGAGASPINVNPEMVRTFKVDIHDALDISR